MNLLTLIFVIASVIDILLAFLCGEAKRTVQLRLIPQDIPGADAQVLLLVVLWHREERSSLLSVNDFSHEGQIIA